MATLRSFGSMHPSRRRTTLVVALLTLLALLVSGCGTDAAWTRLGMPEPATQEGHRVLNLWRGGWVAALAVGFFMWGLILGACVLFRRRAGETGLPPQVRYNVPIEVLYTVTPFVMIAVYFFYTVRDEDKLLELQTLQEGRDHRINVVGKRWSWDFNYLTEGVYQDGTPGEPPTLVLPRGERVEFVLTSRDVIHSFWVPAFLFKLDMIPGRVNRFQVVPEKTGTFVGKCAELCGQDHSRMLFNVRVVEPPEFRAHVEQLRALGQTGELPTDIGPREVTEGQSEAEVRQ
jgi:cytochrome c oxidase subunit 2